MLPDRHPEEHRVRVREDGMVSTRSRSSDSPSAEHFVDDVAPVTGADGSRSTSSSGSGSTSTAAARPRLRAAGPGGPHDRRHGRGRGRRPADLVVSGVKDLVVLKSTGSEFAGFLGDEFTTLRRDPRPGAGDLARRPLALRRLLRHRVAGVVRRGQAAPCWSGSPPCTAWPCSRRCGRWAGGPRAATGGRRDRAGRAEHPPLRLRPGAVRAGQPRRGASTPTTVPTG